LHWLNDVNGCVVHQDIHTAKLLHSKCNRSERRLTVSYIDWECVSFAACSLDFLSDGVCSIANKITSENQSAPAAARPWARHLPRPRAQPVTIALRPVSKNPDGLQSELM
jgi:hypothetical protein